MNHGTMFGRLGRFALAVSLMMVLTSAALAGGSSDQLCLVDPFVAYDRQASSAANPQETATVSPAAATVAVEISQIAMHYPDSVDPAGCIESIDDCAAVGCGETCDCGDVCDTCCGPERYWFAGAEATFLVPDFSNGGLASFELIDNNAPARDELVGGVLDMDDMEFSPRVWVGVQQGCWGLAGRFWHVDGGESVSEPFTGIDEQSIGYNFRGNFEAYTIDLEATRAIHLCKSDHVMSFGVRYASIENNGRLTTISDTVDGLFVTDANYRQLAHGTGITTSLSGTKPIGCTCLKAFYNLRGSLLWGPTDTSVEVLAATTGASAVDGAATRIDDEDLFIGEVQFGLQIDRRLQCIPADAFLRVAGEYQYWNADDGRSFAGAFVGYGPVLDPTSVAATYSTVGGVEANLFGFSIATGVAW